MCYMLRQSHSFRFDNPNNIWWAVQINKLLIMQFPSLPRFFVPLRLKFCPQHIILKHAQPPFLRQCERASFTPIQNNRRNYSSMYLPLYIFGYRTRRHKILNQMIANIPWLQSALSFVLNGIWFFNLLKPTGYVMHHQFNIQQLYVLPIHCNYVFCIYSRTNSDLCHLQHKLIGFYNRDEKCLQRGTDWVFK
jgi:hypothetical protein